MEYSLPMSPSPSPSRYALAAQAESLENIISYQVYNDLSEQAQSPENNAPYQVYNEEPAVYTLFNAGPPTPLSAGSNSDSLWPLSPPYIPSTMIFGFDGAWSAGYSHENPCAFSNPMLSPMTLLDCGQHNQTPLVQPHSGHFMPPAVDIPPAYPPNQPQDRALRPSHADQRASRSLKVSMQSHNSSSMDTEGGHETDRVIIGSNSDSDCRSSGHQDADVGPLYPPRGSEKKRLKEVPRRRLRRRKSELSNDRCEGELCGQQFERAHNLKQHMDTHDMKLDKPFSCNIEGCGQPPFARLHDLERHRATHSLYKPWECAHCPYSAAREDTLRRHQEGACRRRRLLPKISGL